MAHKEQLSGLDYQPTTELLETGLDQPEASSEDPGVTVIEVGDFVPMAQADFRKKRRGEGVWHSNSADLPGGYHGS